MTKETLSSLVISWGETENALCLKLPWGSCSFLLSFVALAQCWKMVVALVIWLPDGEWVYLCTVGGGTKPTGPGYLALFTALEVYATEAELDREVN